MHYIFLDLEWNNTYSKEHKRNINEIIEIGAVKLDEELNLVSKFDCIVRSKLTKKLSSRFKNLTHISNDEMKEGVKFSEAIKRFLLWAGKGNITITWSNSDLYAIIENYDAFLPNNEIDIIESYLDLQGFYQSVVPHESNNQLSLKTAAEEVGISFDEMALHRASDDSELTALIFKKICHKGNFLDMIADAKQPEFYDRLKFKPFMITDINSPYFNGEDLSFICKRCQRVAKCSNNWTVKNNQLYSDYKCEKCGYKFVGRICAKRLYDSTKIRKSAISIKKKSNAKKAEAKAVSSK